ncbi:MAG: helix-turn-helix domain-containing protein [Pseudonocardia sp.]|nr:helix-turn-helix domain-containing protein [Pseudonocardia sp.]
MSDRPRDGKDELSRTLHELRSAAGLSTRQAGAQAGFSQSKVSRIEQGRNVPTEDDVVALADVYLAGEHADPEVRRRLVELARDIRAEHRPVVMARSKGRPDVFQARLARIEAASAHVRSFAPTAVTGLLQTESYMRSLIAERDLPAERVDAFVRARFQRQAGLAGGGRQYTIITSEAALGWRLGSHAAMADQASHIADVIGRYPTVHIGVIPWGAAADRLVLHGWDIYDERAVCYGTADATAILTEPRDVSRYLELHASIEKMAVWENDAKGLLSRLAELYREGRKQ